MRNDRQAYLSIRDHISAKCKVNRINATALPYRMRLAAIVACDTRQGKVWS